LEQVFEQLTEEIARAGIRIRGQPWAHFRYREKTGIDFDIGFPIDPSDEVTARKAGLGIGETAGGETFVHIHRGPYATLADTYRRMERTIVQKGLKGRDDLWEVYLNDPEECRASDLLTQIVWPIEEAAYAQ
jgi:AraC family transcriptional regulator